MAGNCCCHLNANISNYICSFSSLFQESYLIRDICRRWPAQSITSCSSSRPWKLVTLLRLPIFLPCFLCGTFITLPGQLKELFEHILHLELDDLFSDHNQHLL